VVVTFVVSATGSSTSGFVGVASSASATGSLSDSPAVVGAFGTSVILSPTEVSALLEIQTWASSINAGKRSLETSLSPRRCLLAFWPVFLLAFWPAFLKVWRLLAANVAVPGESWSFLFFFAFRSGYVNFWRRFNGGTRSGLSARWLRCCPLFSCGGYFNYPIPCLCCSFFGHPSPTITKTSDTPQI
jgi:hypothetical protein